MTKLNLLSLSVLLLSFLPSGLWGQESIDSIYSFENYKRLNSSLPGEKVYLHLDRPNYMQGDTIWFKAYSWFGYEQLADTVSKVLYVELLKSERQY